MLSEPHSRALAAAELGKIGDESALDALRERMRNDPSKAVRINAEEAINSIMIRAR